MENVSKRVRWEDARARGEVSDRGRQGYIETHKDRYRQTEIDRQANVHRWRGVGRGVVGRESASERASESERARARTRE
jgi:hypothetical protein